MATGASSSKKRTGRVGRPTSTRMDSRVQSLATTPVGDSPRLKSALDDVTVARATDVRYQPSGRDEEFRDFERARNISRRCSIQINIFLRTRDQERFPQSGIVTATGRHPPPPRVAGPAEAQLAFTPVAPHFCTAGKSKHSVKRLGHPAGESSFPREKGEVRRPFCRRQPIARLLRWTALRSKNSAWLTSAETVDCWYGLETRKAGSGRSPVRKRSG